MAKRTPIPWLTDGGLTGALMREHDWSKSPLGHPNEWSPALRSAVGLLLGSEFPMFVAWGPELGFLYNDAYALILGAKHPAAMGSRFHDIWSEIWDDIFPLIDRAMAGTASYQEDLPLTMNRRGYDEDTWFTFSYSPVRDETGKVAGMFCAVVETTGRVRWEQQQRFLTQVDEQLRDLSDADEILSVSAKLLGEFLHADRAHWAFVEPEHDHFEVAQEWRRPGIASMLGAHRLSGFGEDILRTLSEGQVVAVSDLEAEAGPPEALEASLGDVFQGALSMPLVRAGQWKAALCVHTIAPRRWADDDCRLIRELAERAWTRAQRATAERDVRASEQRFRALVNATSDIVYRMSPDWTEMRVLDGRGFLADTEEPSVAWMDAYLFPEDQPVVRAAVDAAIRNKTPFQLEHRVRRVDGSEGWTFSRAIPLLDHDGEIVEWFGAATDITVRKSAEMHLRLMVNELNHRVKNSLATVQAIAAQTLRRGEISEEVREALTSRLIALSNAHDVLTAQSWSGAELAELIRQTAAPFRSLSGGLPIAVQGPDAILPPKTAIALALALHELATNAAKYGSLSRPEGHVEVSWTLTPRPVGTGLHLVWREVGGPPVKPPTRTGFGTRLIQRGLASELEGEAMLDYRTDGLVCTIDALIRAEASNWDVPTLETAPSARID